VEGRRGKKCTMDTIKEELKQEIKLEFSQIASQHSPSLQAHDIQVLAASVSSKGSCAAPKTNAIGKKASDMHGDSVGLHVIAEKSTKLVALGKLYDTFGTIHNVPYADDVVRVSVVKVYDGDAQVPFPTSEIKFVRVAVGTFVGWPTHLVKPISNEVITIVMNTYIIYFVTWLLMLIVYVLLYR